MSLINEALRRADAEMQGTAPPEPALPPVPDVPEAPPRTWRGIQVVLSAATLGAIGVAGFLLWMQYGQSAKEAAASLLRGASPQQAAAASPVEVTPVVARPTTPAKPQAPEAAPSAPRRAEPAKDLLPGGPSLFLDSSKTLGMPLDASAARALAPVAPILPASAATETVFSPPAPPPAPPAAAPAPAKPAPAAEPDPPKLTVTSIAGRPGGGGVAIINGRVVEIGDTIEGAKVISITPRAVEVEFAGKRFTLGL